MRILGGKENESDIENNTDRYGEHSEGLDYLETDFDRVEDEVGEADEASQRFSRWQNERHQRGKMGVHGSSSQGVGPSKKRKSSKRAFHVPRPNEKMRKKKIDNYFNSLKVPPKSKNTSINVKNWREIPGETYSPLFEFPF